MRPRGLANGRCARREGGESIAGQRAEARGRRAYSAGKGVGSAQAPLLRNMLTGPAPVAGPRQRLNRGMRLRWREIAKEDAKGAGFATFLPGSLLALAGHRVVLAAVLL